MVRDSTNERSYPIGEEIDPYGEWGGHEPAPCSIVPREPRFGAVGIYYYPFFLGNAVRASYEGRRRIAGGGVCGGGRGTPRNRVRIEGFRGGVGCRFDPFGRDGYRHSRERVFRLHGLIPSLPYTHSPLSTRGCKQFFFGCLVT
jgi:hypothetical protein